MKINGKKIHFPTRGFTLLELSFVLTVIFALMIGLVIAYKNANEHHLARVRGETLLTEMRVVSDQAPNSAQVPTKADLAVPTPFATIDAQPISNNTNELGLLGLILVFIATLIAVAKFRLYRVERADWAIASRDVVHPSMNSMMVVLVTACAARGSQELEKKALFLAELHGKTEAAGLRHNDQRYADIISPLRSATKKMEKAKNLTEIENHLLRYIDQMISILQDILENPAPHREEFSQNQAVSLEKVAVNAAEIGEEIILDTALVQSEAPAIGNTGPSDKPTVAGSVALIVVGIFMLWVPGAMSGVVDAVEPVASSVQKMPISEGAQHLQNELNTMAHMMLPVFIIFGLISVVAGMTRLKSFIDNHI